MAPVCYFQARSPTAARERVLARFAADYSLARWVDEVLPPGAVVATDRRSMLFLRRRTLPADFCEMTALSPLAESGKHQRLLELIEKGEAQFVLVTLSPRRSCYREVVAVLGAPVLVSPPFRDPARNPWRAGPETTVAIYDVTSGGRTFAGFRDADEPTGILRTGCRRRSDSALTPAGQGPTIL